MVVVTSAATAPRPACPLAPVAFADRRQGIARLESFVSRHTGVVSDVHEIVRRPGDARLVRHAAMPTFAPELLGSTLDHLEGASGGIDDDRAASRAAAIGETLERYAAAWVPPGAVLATADELGPEAVDPETVALFAAEQHAAPGFPHVPFTRSTVVRWIRGFSLPDGEPAWLPAQLVLLAEADPREESIDRGSSSGLACGQTLEEAVLTGLFEAFERDAFLTAWLHRLSLPFVDWHDDRRLRRLTGSAFDPVRASYQVVDLSGVWHVPTALAVVRGRPGDGAALAVGAAAAASGARAVAKALGEAFSVRAWLLHLRDEAPWGPAIDPESFADHARLYGDEVVAARAAFLWQATERRPLRSLPQVHGATPLAQIEQLCSRLAARGLRAYAADVTSPDVAAGGLRVARAFVPGFIALAAGHAGRHLGGRRILAAAAESGLGPPLDRLADLNSDPHPFP